jgi:hypothetical protein
VNATVIVGAFKYDETARSRNLRRVKNRAPATTIVSYSLFYDLPVNGPHDA